MVKLSENTNKWNKIDTSILKILSRYSSSQWGKMMFSNHFQLFTKNNGDSRETYAASRHKHIRCAFLLRKIIATEQNIDRRVS